MPSHPAEFRDQLTRQPTSNTGLDPAELQAERRWRRFHRMKLYRGPVSLQHLADASRKSVHFQPDLSPPLQRLVAPNGTNIPLRYQAVSFSFYRCSCDPLPAARSGQWLGGGEIADPSLLSQIGKISPLDGQSFLHIPALFPSPTGSAGRGMSSWSECSCHVPVESGSTFWLHASFLGCSNDIMLGDDRGCSM